MSILIWQLFMFFRKKVPLLNMFFEVGNVSDVLLKIQQINNQHNTKELPCYFLLPTIEKRVFQAYNASGNFEF